MAFYIFSISLVYGAFQSTVSRKIYPFIFAVPFLVHITSLLEKNTFLNDDIFATGIFTISIAMYTSLTRTKNAFLFLLIWVYLFIATSLYISYFFKNPFALTFYWTLIFLVCIYWGITKEKQYLRTI